MSLRIGGIETGGTTFKISLAIDHPTNVIEQTTIPTTTPLETLDKVIELVSKWNIDTLGIASFGPIDIDPRSPTYGFITTTPKPNWGNTDVVNYIHKGLLDKAKEIENNDENIAKIQNLSIGWNTDCNAAAAVELLYGQSNNDEKPVSSLAYITIGTGIGIGIAIDITNDVTKKIENNETPKLIKLITNMLHPEAGHIVVRRHSTETITNGLCPYHGECLEGLANNHATAKRANCLENELPNLPDHDHTFKCTSFYVAQLCLNLIYTVSPHRIVIGGGLAQRKIVMEYIRQSTTELNNGYVQTPYLKDIDNFIVSSFFDRSGSKTSPGAVGALWLGFEKIGKK